MSNSVCVAFSSIEVSELARVHGGTDPATAAAQKTLVKTVTQVGKKAIPIVGQAITVAEAGKEAVDDYNKARAAGDSRLSATGSAALGGLNSLTFGLSNWIIGR